MGMYSASKEMAVVPSTPEIGLLYYSSFNRRGEVVAKEFGIKLLGLFSFIDHIGNSVAPKGRKANALIAMLATAPDGRRRA